MLYLLFLKEGGGSCLWRLCFSAAFKLFVYLLEPQLHHLIRHNVDPTAETELQRLRTDQIQPERTNVTLVTAGGSVSRAQGRGCMHVARGICDASQGVGLLQAH